MKLFRVKGEFREGYIDFSDEAPFFLHSQATEEKLAKVQ